MVLIAFFINFYIFRFCTQDKYHFYDQKKAASFKLQQKSIRR